MHTALVSILVGLMGVINAPAQGRINFNNTSATPIRISDGTTTLVLGTASTATFGFGPASVRVQLFAGLDSAALAPVLIGALANQLYVTNTTSTLATAQGTFPGGFPLYLPGFDGSQPVYLQFTVSPIDLGGLAHWAYAVSPIIRVSLTLAPEYPTQVFSTPADASHWDGITITRIPEPTTASILGLGVLLALFPRCRWRFGVTGPTGHF